MDDTYYMRKALRLAEKGTGHVSPNPRVGAVIVENDHILSTGYHAAYGKVHAEVDAISKLPKEALEGSCIYVNLEPCSHYGKTPPCVNAIIESGISRVVVGMQDPNPLVSGNGIRKLIDCGIEVKQHVLEEDCIRINQGFIKFIQTKQPFVTIKIAQTLDGFIATENGLSKWITSEKARSHVQKIRHESDAILVGVQTIVADDPSLTIRNKKHSGLKRFILDSTLRIPEHAKLLSHPDPENTYIVTTEKADQKAVEKLEAKGVHIWKIGRREISLLDLMKRMGEIGVASLLVEGGAQVFTSFIKENLADRVMIFYAPKLFGTGIPSFLDLGVRQPDKAFRFKQCSWKKIGDEMMFEGQF